MAGPRTYLDWNATAPLRPQARDAMLAALDLVGNPSSVHAEGRAARAAVERARAQVAAAVGCAPPEVIFTAGATEGAQVLRFLPGPVLVQPTAHDAVFAQARAGGGDAALAMGLANSETGVISAVPDRDAQGWDGGRARWLMLDITQGVGRIPFSFAWSGADLAILSAHKLGGPKGVGALIVRDGTDLPPLALGGGQEMGRRAGTENVAGIVGFGAAAQGALADLDAGAMDGVAELRNLLEGTLATAFPMTIFVGQDTARLPNTSCILTPGWKAETQVMQMDLAGFAVSAGSACSSGKVRASRTLAAMGWDEDAARSALRVSLGVGTTADDIGRFCDAWIAARTRHGDRQRAPARREG